MSGAPEKAGSSSIDVVEMTAEQAQAGFASRVFTSEGLTQAFLDRMAIYNEFYNAIVFLNPNALGDARVVDRRRAAGETLGPLSGVPVRDAMDMAGFPTTVGWRLLYGKTGGTDLLPIVDAPVVARMRAVGAVILGKTSIPVRESLGILGSGN